MKLLLLFGIVAVLSLGLLAYRASAPTGIPLDVAQFETITGSQIACSSVNASTSVVGGNAGRTSFIATNIGANNIDLCRAASTCSSTSSILLPPISSGTALSRFEQSDGYVGPYICRAQTATTSLNVVYSN